MNTKNDFSYEIEIYKKYYTHEPNVYVISFFEHCLSCYSVGDIFRKHNIGEKKDVIVNTPLRTRFNKGSKKHRVSMMTVTIEDLENLIKTLQELLEKRQCGKLAKTTEKHLNWVVTAYNFCLALQNSYE